MRLALSLLICALGVLSVLGAPALAEPGYFRVVGVASDDTLNVRAEPSARSPDIGDLPHNATRLEVSARDASGDWGRIVWEEGDGWIAMRFLEPDPLQMVSGAQLPAGLVCAGTEPFWTMNLSEGSAGYSEASGAFHTFSLRGTRVADGQARFPVQVDFAGSTAAATLLVRPAQCSDGMSDRGYPWQVDMFLNTAEGGRLLTGCCQLPIDVGFH